jgi:hypothetical protein
MAEDENPALRALRDRERAAAHRTKAAWGDFGPTVALSASWSGFTQELTDLDPVIRGQQGAYAAAYGSCFTNDSIRTGSGLAPLGCNQYVWGSEQEAALRSANDQFPFGFTSQPFRARIDIHCRCSPTSRARSSCPGEGLRGRPVGTGAAQALFVVTGVTRRSSTCGPRTARCRSRRRTAGHRKSRCSSRRSATAWARARSSS